MAIAQLLIKNLSNTPLPVQAVFERSRQFSQVIGVGKSVDIGGTATPDEVSRNSEIQNLIAKGKISVTWIQGTSDIAPVPGIEDGQGKATSQVMRVPCVAGVGGGADDVVIYSANSPRIRVIDAFFICSTSIGGGTVTLRTATGGGGTAISDALSAAAPGVARNASVSATTSLAAASTLVIRRNHNTIAGEMVILVDNS